MVRENRIKSYTFNTGSLTANAMTGSHFKSYTDHALNGDLRAIQILASNYQAVGSLLLEVSGTGELIWSLTSGTNSSMVSTAGQYIPVGLLRHTNNNLLSGTSLATYGTIPLFGIYSITGSGVKGSGTGFTIYYQ